ncbi:metal ABC transporter ATP-binding protein [Macrococcus lamae]|uniref:Metal ABC transporter ATP-binding protein n=1 Tax=Macrococcus lamae TaxID=198484 RepID=A0A4R6BYF1_9STAP|nr:metal ABC transporter ATP-binding protein [Macrococcus lamae]TDM13123.1 metal ABC transporter ATP-binding protein [Macrococcus lamae]
MEPIFEIKNVNYRYPDKVALKDINIKIYPGSFTAIVGPNGSGKSTLLKLILGILQLQTGMILINGKPMTHQLPHKIGYVSQKANAGNTGFPATVREVITSGLTQEKKLFQRYNAHDRERVTQLMERLHIIHLQDKNISQLSGGQQQRVFIARALVANPSILILDEPTVGIDAKHVAEFYKLLSQLKSEGITILLVTHDIGIVADTATSVVCLNQHLHFHGTTQEFKSLDQVEISKIYGHPVQFVDHDHQRECCQ